MMMAVPDTWAGWASMSVVAALMFGIAYTAIRARLGIDFTPRSELAPALLAIGADHVKLEARVTDVEKRLVNMATRTDVQRVESKVGEISENVAKLAGGLDGLETGQDRIFRQLQVLIAAKLPAEGDDS